MSYQAMERVFALSRARGGSRLVLLALASHADAVTMTAYPSVETLRQKAGLDHGRSVTRCLRELENLGEIIRDGTAYRGVQRYRITLSTPDPQVTPSDPRPLTYRSPDPQVTPDLQVTPTPDPQVTPPLTPRSAEPSSTVSQPSLLVDGAKQPKADRHAAHFPEFWVAYPSRGDAPNPRKPAAEKFAAAVKRGTDPNAIIAAAKGYAAAVERNRTEPKFVKQAVTWLNQACWEQYQHQPEPAPKSLAERLGVTPLGF